MPPVKIKDGEELNTILTENSDEMEGLKAQNEEQATALKKLTDVIAEAKVDAAAMLEQIKTITLATKVKGSWKEQNTADAKAYKIGQFMQAMLEWKRGSNLGYRKLGEMGCGLVGDKPEDKQNEIVMNKTAAEMEKAGLSSTPLTGDDSVGSYSGSVTLPVIYNSELLRVAMDSSAMMPLVRQVPNTAITQYWPATATELAFTKLTNQNTDKTEDTIVFSQVTLTTEIYAAYVAVVEEFIEDSLVPIGALLRDMFAEAWGKKFDNLALRDSTYGAMATSGINEVITSGAGFADVDADDMVSMIPELDDQTKRSNGRFFIHVTNWDTIENEKLTTGEYRLRQPAEGAPLRLKGYPVTFTDGGMPDLAASAASTSFAAFGNPQRIFSGTRIPFEFRVFDQTQSTMESGQVFFRVRVRQAMALSIADTWVKLTTNS